MSSAVYWLTATTALPDRIHQRERVVNLSQRGLESFHLVVEPVPQHVCLGREVPVERSARDLGFARDVLHRGLVEAALDEKAEGDDLELSRASRGWPTAADGVVLGGGDRLIMSQCDVNVTR